MNSVLLAAPVYNGLWGGFVVLFTLALFRVLEIQTPNYTQIWQCVGMFVGVYSVEYAITALDPVRHRPVVLAGLLGKILRPIAFLCAVIRGTLPLSFGVTILKNDLIWCASSPSSSSGPTRPTERCRDERVTLYGAPAVNTRVRSSIPLKRFRRSL